MTVRQFATYLASMALCAAVAAWGEPRPVGLIVGGFGAITVTFSTIRELGR